MSLQVVINPGVVPDYPALAVSLGISDFTTANGGSPLGHAFPSAGYFVVQRCNGTTTFTDGPLTSAQVAAIPACTADANAATLRSRAQTALGTNATFLALASPTAAQVATQTKALTRQCDGLIRLALGLLSDITDS